MGSSKQFGISSEQHDVLLVSSTRTFVHSAIGSLRTPVSDKPSQVFMMLKFAKFVSLAIIAAFVLPRAFGRTRFGDLMTFKQKLQLVHQAPRLFESSDE
jgi:hypothetical protein